MLFERIFFVIERITDILNLEKEIQVGYLDDVRGGIMELHEELSRLVNYLRHVEEGRDGPLHDHYRFYDEISVIAVSSDNILENILDCVVSNHAVAITNELHSLVKSIRNSYILLPSQSNYYINTTGNINMSGQQSIGPINLSSDRAESSQIKRVSRPKTYGHVPNSDFVGFNHEIETLLTHLLQHDDTHVVGIVGMGGAGKTTLAKQIYHHPQIRANFNCKVWVCITQSWDKTSILNSIWRQAIQNPKAVEMGYDQIVESLNQHLSSKSYLVILDDIWSADAWYDISPALPPCSGGKVVITSRNKLVPQRSHPTVIIIKPEPLNKKQSLKLFKKRTFLPNENISHVLRQLGEEMVQKCKGLPLAITALAGILRMDKRQISWERINKRLAHSILHMEDNSTQGVVKEVLGLSYYELPLYLKPCVLYLHIFPEDYVIKSKVLIKMWIAEYFIKTDEDDQVSTAERYLDEMVQRCIIEVVKTNFMGQVSRFRIHDLIRQMFVDMDQKRGFLKDPLRLAPSITFNCRYGYRQNNSASIWESPSSANLERIVGTETNSQVRSMIFLSYLFLYEDNILQRLFEKFRLLRVLVLSVYQEVIMPEEIGSLIHLRYLELGGYIQPAVSIGNLVHLWTLDMRNIYLSKAVQRNFNLCKLKELRHLFFSSYFYYPPHQCWWQTNWELGRLKKLKTLWHVAGGGWLLSSMPILSADLRGLHIFINMDDSEESSEEQLEIVFRTPSISSNNLQTLELNWKQSHCKLHDMNILSKCKSLNKLKLEGRIKVGTPIVFPPNLIKLTLIDTYLEEKEVMNIISESCPCLKILTLGGFAYMGSKLVCNANSFLQLGMLTLESLYELRMWIIETSAMPSLHHLMIHDMAELYLDLNPEGWTFISNIPQLTYFGPKGSAFEKKLQQFRKYDQNPSQSTDVFVTNYKHRSIYGVW